MSDGKHNGQLVYCPVNCRNENDCPYAKDGICHCENPSKECNDFAMFFPNWKDWEDA